MRRIRLGAAVVAAMVLSMGMLALALTVATGQVSA